MAEFDDDAALVGFEVICSSDLANKAERWPTLFRDCSRGTRRSGRSPIGESGEDFLRLGVQGDHCQSHGHDVKVLRTTPRTLELNRPRLVGHRHALHIAIFTS